MKFIQVYGSVLKGGKIGFTGSFIRAFFLKVISSIDEDLAEDLHSPKGFSPYAVDPLAILSGSKYIYHLNSFLKNGDGIRFGFSLLGDKLESLWFKIVENLMDINSVNIGDLEISINETAVKNFDLDLNPTLSYIVSFKTPTFFRKMGNPYRNLLPEPRALFMSLARIYNELHEDKLNLEELYEKLEKEIGITHHKLSTIKPIEIGKGRRAIGFIGKCIYETKSKDLGVLMGKLLKLGEFTNVGGSRTLGFGVIRVKAIRKNGNIS